MLAGALAYLAILSVLAAAFLTAGLDMTRAAIHRSAQTYLSAGYQRAMASLQQSVLAQMQSGQPASPMPAFTPLPARCIDANTPCRFTDSETIAFTQRSAPVATASCDPNTDACAQNEQANTFVDEERVTARIVVTIAAPDGSALASRSTDVALRVTKTPPYVVAGSAIDDAFDGLPQADGPGDDGGIAPATPSPCASPQTGVTDDTAVRVAYRNSVSNACSDASSWRTQSYNTAPSAPSGWSP